MGVLKILDANLNRASEGLRVIEDIGRFLLQNQVLSSRTKTLRHGIRKSASTFALEALWERDVTQDPGVKVSQKTTLDQKNNLADLLTANFKRSEEALRCLEECLKMMHQDSLSKTYETFRFSLYALEQDYGKVVYQAKGKTFQPQGLYCITASEHSNGRDNLDVVVQMISAGVTTIQYREKELEMGEKYAQCLKIRALTQEAGVTFIVNDHVDLALAVQADGIHIGQDDMPVAVVRKLVGNNMLIGVSTHSPEQAQKAVQSGADYIGVGPIFETKTKKNVCAPVGLSYLAYAVAHVPIPFVAIGGIKEHNVQQVLDAGAPWVAMVTEITKADNIPQKIANIKRKFAEVKRNG